jgi:hypothetical protein
VVVNQNDEEDFGLEEFTPEERLLLNENYCGSFTERLPREAARSKFLKLYDFILTQNDDYRYHKCLNRKEFFGALHCLHRYFDFCVDIVTPSQQPDQQQQKSLVPYL